MKHMLRTLSFVALLGGSVISSPAQSVVAEDDFQTYPSGTFNPPEAEVFKNFEATDPKAEIVTTNGLSGSTDVLQFSAVFNPQFNLAGVFFKPRTQPDGANNSPNRADYTLTFDFALTGDLPLNKGDFEVTILGTDNDTGIILAPDVSALHPGDGFQTFTVDLDDNPKQFFDKPLLDPRARAYRIGVAVIKNFVESQKQLSFMVDNIRVTMKKSGN